MRSCNYYFTSMFLLNIKRDISIPLVRALPILENDIPLAEKNVSQRRKYPLVLERKKKRNDLDCRIVFELSLFVEREGERERDYGSLDSVKSSRKDGSVRNEASLKEEGRVEKAVGVRSPVFLYSQISGGRARRRGGMERSGSDLC